MEYEKSDNSWVYGVDSIEGEKKETRDDLNKRKIKLGENTFQSVKGSQNVIGGAGGSGAGGDLMGEPTTEEPDTTPQPTRPTNPAVMSTRAVETTVKPVPSTVLPTTTTKSELTNNDIFRWIVAVTTTTSPSTEAPVKTSPVEMVTNQPETTISELKIYIPSLEKLLQL